MIGRILYTFLCVWAFATTAYLHLSGVFDSDSSLWQIAIVLSALGWAMSGYTVARMVWKYHPTWDKEESEKMDRELEQLREMRGGSDANT